MAIEIQRIGLDTAKGWQGRAKAEYERLGWVYAEAPLNKMVELANLRGDEQVIDAATGSGAILDALAPHLDKGGHIIGFDISRDMLSRRKKPLPPNASLRVADIYDTGFPDQSADLVTARQVYHNLADISGATQEIARILRTRRGKLIVSEYVTINPAVQEFEFPIFEKKEPGRHLWTGQQLAETIAGIWLPQFPYSEVKLDFAVLENYSVGDWMSRSGLPIDTQSAIIECYRNAPAGVKKVMNMHMTPEGDVLVDRPFAFVTAKK